MRSLMFRSAMPIGDYLDSNHLRPDKQYQSLWGNKQHDLLTIYPVSLICHLKKVEFSAILAGNEWGIETL